jgi:hypothetical protein
MNGNNYISPIPVFDVERYLERPVASIALYAFFTIKMRFCFILILLLILLGHIKLISVDDRLAGEFLISNVSKQSPSRTHKTKQFPVDNRSSVEIFLDNGTISPATDGFWRQPIPKTAPYEPANLDAARVLFDLNYNVITSNSDPLIDVYVPAAWNKRVDGTQWLGKVHFPDGFILPDAAPNNTPNNPLCTVNKDTQIVECFNAVARPTSGTPLYAYRPVSHGGSSLSGGDITGKALQRGRIKHAIAIAVWAKKYLSFYQGGFIAPAVRADSYASTETYGGQNKKLVMGTRLALQPENTPTKLGISCSAVIPIIQALQTYGAYIIDDSAWDAFYISTDQEAAEILQPCCDDLLKIYQALKIVNAAQN